MPELTSFASLLPVIGDLWAWVGSVWLAVAVGQAGWVVMQKRSPVSTVAWIVALCLLPVAGLIVYRYLGPQRVQRQRLKRLHSRAALASRTEVQALHDEHPDAPLWALQHSRLIERCSGIALSSAHAVQVLQDGVCTLAAMRAAIAQARHHVHLEYYIYEPDRIGSELLAALVHKLREGVTVRLLVDAVGSPLLASRKGRPFLREFLDNGGQFAVFHPNRLDRLRPLVNLRSHRKILICDGRVGFTGGINITETENEALRNDAFRDTHLQLDGPAVRWLQLVFLEDWVYARGDDEKRRLDGELIVNGEPGAIAVQIAASGPDTDGEAIHRSMIDALYTARQRIWLTTPYFVPTEPALYALTGAALRGVDVRLLVPRRGDSRLVTAAARSYFDELLRAGVKVHEYLPRMLHAKTLIVDDNYAQIGTANFDHRSFRLNFEVAAVVFDTATNAQLAAAFEQDLKASRAAPPSKRLHFPARLEQALARLFSPVL